MKINKRLLFIIFSIFIIVKSYELNKDNKRNELKHMIKKLSSVSKRNSISFNNNYLRGYNYITGNPLGQDELDISGNSGNSDNGFKKYIFKSEEVKYITNTNNNINYAKGYNILPFENCKNNNKISMYGFGLQFLLKYQSLINETNNVKINRSFSANDKWIQYRNELESKDYSIIGSTSICSVFKVFFQFFNPPDLSDEFIQSLKNLNGKSFKSNPDEFFNFINDFGTHYVKEATLGASQISNAYFKKKDFEELSNDMNNETTFHNFANNNKADKQITYRKGPKFNLDNNSPDYKSWIIEIRKNPEIINFSLDTLDNLLRNTNLQDTLLKNGININIFEISYSVSDAISNFCDFIKTCKIPVNPYFSVIKKAELNNNNYYPYFLDINCGPGAAITYFTFEYKDDKLSFNYKCLISPEIISNECWEKQTEPKKAYKNMYDIIDRPIKCSDNRVLNRFSIETDPDQMSVYYRYNCCDAFVYSVKDINVNSNQYDYDYYDNNGTTCQCANNEYLYFMRGFNFNYYNHCLSNCAGYNKNK